MQNTMQITAKWSRSKPEVEFQYGGGLFAKRSYISAVILTIFGMVIDIDFLKKATHPVRYGSKIAPQRPPSWKSIRRHISAVSNPILVKYGMLTQNDLSITAMRSKSKLKKMTNWKRKIAHWSCRYVNPGCYSNVRVCIFAGVAQLHSLLNSGTAYCTHR